MTYRNQAEEALYRTREDLPVAAQLLHAVADLLTSHRPEDPVTTHTLGLAFTYAGVDVLARYPSAVRDDALARAMRLLPSDSTLAPAVTGGEYALQLRAAAKGA
ncbi:hypothetical protein ACGFXC_09175 [Streptomyces sp. NPDC048507]|uniref:hypothetical protein n=1 Tax=Streptomyces sp. NPDC048507 TaxID=3365560 RepID=UPI003718EF20